LTVRKDDVDSMINLAAAYRACLGLHNPDRVYELSKRAVRQAPSYGLAHLNLGNYFGEYGMEWYVVEKDESNTERPYFVKRTTNTEMLRLAIESYNKAAELDDNLRPQCNDLRAIVERVLERPTSEPI